MSMKKPELGMIQLSLMGWIAVGAAVVIGLMYLRISYLETKVELADAFQESVERAGETARKEANRINKENLAKKEKADVELKKLRLANADLNKRLRDNASRSFVPRTEADPTKFERACFDQSAIDAAIKRFAERVTGIVEQGQDALDSLNNAKTWAANQ